MIKKIKLAHKLEGIIKAPGDKSISHRAALLNSIANGVANITNFCEGDDETAMIGCLKQLGADISEIPNNDKNSPAYKIRGNGLNGLSEPKDILYAGNSGTAMRLISGLLAGQDFYSVISGDNSLRSRPMKRITTPLTMMGADIYGRSNASYAPLTFNPKRLNSIEYDMPIASAQLKSCLLIASLYASGETLLNQPEESRDHTEKMLSAMGAPINKKDLAIKIKPGELSSINVKIPSDTSGSAFWIVAACCHPNAQLKITNVGMNPTRIGVIEVLQSMGANLKFENESIQGGEPVADIIASTSQLEGVEISGEIIPRVVDELPILALAACFAKGTTTIKNAEELRVKESDRISTTVDILSKLMANINETPDGMVIKGTGKLIGNEIESHGDHRIAMTGGIAGLLSQGETYISNSDHAEVSYPRFWKTLDTIIS